MKRSNEQNLEIHLLLLASQFVVNDELKKYCFITLASPRCLTVHSRHAADRRLCGSGTRVVSSWPARIWKQQCNGRHAHACDHLSRHTYTVSDAYASVFNFHSSLHFAFGRSRDMRYGTVGGRTKGSYECAA